MPCLSVQLTLVASISTTLISRFPFLADPIVVPPSPRNDPPTPPPAPVVAAPSPAPAATPPPPVITWEWKNDQAGWTVYDQPTIAILETGYQAFIVNNSTVLTFLDRPGRSEIRTVFPHLVYSIRTRSR